MDPQFRGGVKSLSLEQPGSLPHLFNRVVRAAKHDEINVSVFRRGIQIFVCGLPLLLPISQRVNWLAMPKSRLDRWRFRSHAGNVVHLDSARRSCGGAEMF